eukprot:3008010-Pyramimonas_sp.AAC.2
MMNATQAPSKRSSIERQIDGIIFAMFGLLALMCGSGAILNTIWTNNNGPDMWYLVPEAKDYEFNPDGLLCWGDVGTAGRSSAGQRRHVVHPLRCEPGRTYAHVPNTCQPVNGSGPTNRGRVTLSGVPYPACQRSPPST